MVTPMTVDGEVDWAGVESLMDSLISHGADGLVVTGTTGETSTLTDAEKIQLVKTGKEVSAGRARIITGGGSNETAHAIELYKASEKAGADGVMIVTPYYNKPTQAGMVAHFTALHDCCTLPIVIYNIPGRSVVDMQPDTMGKLAQLPRIIGVKDATGDLSRVPKQRITCGKDFVQLSGEDATALGFNAHGGVGCISVTANVAPRLCAEFQEATLAGDYAKALDYQDRLMPLHEAIFLEPGVAGAKYGMSLLGLCSEEVRLPLVGLTDGTKARIKSAMVHAGLLN
jgi:4-hydroxy-tetrahydrodipicolinate synthase